MSIGGVLGKNLHKVDFAASPRNPTAGSTPASAAVGSSPSTIAPRATGALATQPADKPMAHPAINTTTRTAPAAPGRAIAVANGSLSRDPGCTVSIPMSTIVATKPGWTS
jgi:hypothetical protein